MAERTQLPLDRDFHMQGKVSGEALSGQIISSRCCCRSGLSSAPARPNHWSSIAAKRGARCSRAAYKNPGPRRYPLEFPDRQHDWPPHANVLRRTAAKISPGEIWLLAHVATSDVPSASEKQRMRRTPWVAF